MKHIVFTSPKFSGQIELKYSEDDKLILYKDDSQMNADQRDFMIRHIPLNSVQLELLRQVVYGTVAEVPPDLSFNTAYELFGYKRNAFRSEPIWKKMNEGDRMNCIRSFKAYQKHVERKGIAMMCFDRYLRERQWETDWNSLK